MAWQDQVIAAARRHAKPADYTPSYGTGGFRADGSLLASTVFCSGLVAALRSLASSCAATGLMITASHNHVHDNGVKLVESDGSMLLVSWEQHAEALAACADETSLVAALEHVASAQGIILSSSSSSSSMAPIVILGHDTRPTSVSLALAAQQGIEALGGKVISLGLVTTPQLHYAVASYNAQTNDTDNDDLYAKLAPGQRPDAFYLSSMAEAYRTLLASPLPPPPPASSSTTTTTTTASSLLVIDCANGVGATAASHLASLLTTTAAWRLENTGQGVLNHHCGADFVQKERIAPTHITPPTPRAASMDGDADRLVYFALLPTASSSSSSSSSLLLLDGDRIAILAAKYISSLLQCLPDQVVARLDMGVVQTAYANGASTRYIRTALHAADASSISISSCLAKTGVKHLHRAAEHYPIGIYFEANGHGTVLFRPDAVQLLRNEARGDEALASTRAAQALLSLRRLINQTVGDAMSCLLLVELILTKYDWSLHEWADMYHDLPSRNLKVKVRDRTFLTCSENETRVTQPVALQDAIDQLVAASGSSHHDRRAFVRPSGTEDVVRVYAEASTQQEADELAQQVGDLVKKWGAS